MNRMLLPLAAMAIASLPISAHAADPCRNAKGQFAKCGAPGAMSYAQYKSLKGKAVTTGPTAPVAKPATMSMGGKMMMMMSKKKPAPTAATGGKPATAAPVRCKDAKGKYIKCAK